MDDQKAQTNQEYTTENTYWAKQVAETLGIANSTLRKWCLLIENAGYHFIKDDQERRAFTEHDLIMLRHFYQLTQEKGVSLESAVKAVVSRFYREATQDVSLPDMPVKSPSDTRYEAVMEKLEKQESFNQALLERLDQQQAYIENSIQKRDEQLMAAIREIQEQQQLQRQLAAAQEAMTKEKNKKKWWKIW